MKEFSKIKSKLNRMNKLASEIKKYDLTQFVGKKIKITKRYSDWIKEHGEECGVPFDELNILIKKPYGKIVKASYEGMLDGFNFTIQIDGLCETKIVGILDIKIIEV